MLVLCLRIIRQPVPTLDFCTLIRMSFSLQVEGRRKGTGRGPSGDISMVGNCNKQICKHLWASEAPVAAAGGDSLTMTYISHSGIERSP